MNFHLQFPITPFKEKINYSHKFLFMGSCFAENIGEAMQEYKFNCVLNPHGVLYNPASIAVALRRYIGNNLMQENELFFANECWNSWEHHSRFSNSDKQVCLSKINEHISYSHNFIKQADWLFITFGSAFVYKRNQTGELAGNCHKIPQKEFTQQLLSVSEIVEEYKVIFQHLTLLNKNLKIIFTVSPVRYIRDGAVENTLSKARLIEAIHELQKQFDHTFYFPAYELVMDDLRDYRFYKADLVHPNEQAIEYIFEKLKEATFEDETKQLFEELKDVVNARKHRPFNPDSAAHKKFKANYLERCKQLKKQFPFLDLHDELNFFL